MPACETQWKAICWVQHRRPHHRPRHRQRHCRRQQRPRRFTRPRPMHVVGGTVTKMWRRRSMGQSPVCLCLRSTMRLHPPLPPPSLLLLPRKNIPPPLPPPLRSWCPHPGQWPCPFDRLVCQCCPAIRKNSFHNHNDNEAPPKNYICATTTTTTTTITATTTTATTTTTRHSANWPNHAGVRTASASATTHNQAVEVSLAAAAAAACIICRPMKNWHKNG